jgi:antitoxin ParD1/3/4
MPTRNVVITNQQSTMIDRLVKSGRYQNASEVLRQGLRLVQQRDAEDDAKLVALRKAAQVGIDDIEAGRYQDFQSGDELHDFLLALTDRVLAERRR